MSVIHQVVNIPKIHTHTPTLAHTTSHVSTGLGRRTYLMLEVLAGCARTHHKAAQLDFVAAAGCFWYTQQLPHHIVSTVALTSLVFRQLVLKRTHHKAAQLDFVMTGWPWQAHCI